MSATLYLLRRPINKIDPSLFVPSEVHGDVVLLEDAVSSTLTLSHGKVLLLSEESTPGHVSYDDLVERIFQSDRVLVM
jgi:hypothetical protein